MRRASFIAESIASEPEPEKKTRASGVGRERHDAFRELLGRGVRERVEAGVRLDRAHLLGDGVGDLRPAVADVAVPQARHGVDQLVAVAVPQQRALAAGDRDEIPPCRLGERMQKGVGHPSIKPQILSPSCAGRTDALRISGSCRVWQGGGVTTRTDPFTEAARSAWSVGPTITPRPRRSLRR